MTQSDMSWDEMKKKLTEERQSTKTVIFELPKFVMEFQIRMLSQKQYDLARAKMSMSRSRGKSAEIPLNMGEYNREIIRYGVVSGPEGFSAKNDNDVSMLPVEVRDELSNAIENYSNLDEVVRECFRPNRREGAIDTD